MSLWSPLAIEALIFCLVFVLFRGRKSSPCQLQDGFVLVCLGGVICVLEISTGASGSALSRVPGVLVCLEINCCVIIKVAISRSQLRHPAINSHHLQYFILSLWVSSFSAARLPSFTDGELSSKPAISNTNSNNKKLPLFSILYLKH